MAGRGRKVPGGPCPQVRKVHITLPAELARRLGAYAGFHRVSQSEVVARALGPALAGFQAFQRSWSDPPAPAEAPPALPRVAG